MRAKPRYPGIRVTANGNQLVSYHTETRITDAGIFYPITPSTEGGELYQQAFAEGKLNVFGRSTIAVESRGRARGAGRSHRALRMRPARSQFHVRPGSCVRRGAVLPRARQMLDHGAGSWRPRAHQACAERTLRPRRRVRRARYRLDHPVWQRRPTGRRPGAHPAARHRTQPDSGNERAGRIPHLAP